MEENQRVCIVRAKPNNIDLEEEFLKAGIASIGWSEIDDLHNPQESNGLATWDEIFKKLKIEYKEEARSIHATQIYTFITLPIGAIIVSPSHKTRDVHLFEVVSSYVYDLNANTESIGNPHQLRVKHLKTISRTAFPQELQGVLNAAKKAVTDISRFWEIVSTIAYDDSPQNSFVGLPSSVAARVDATLLELLKSESGTIRMQAALGLLDNPSEEIRLQAALILKSQ
jgi:predicted Mrr-cat superfamily restriction endonuclease